MRIRSSGAFQSRYPDTNDAILTIGEQQEVDVLGSFETEFERVNCVAPAIPEHCYESWRAVLINEEPLAVGCSGISRSETASAAKRNAAATSSTSNGGSSSTISSAVRPPATMLTTVATGGG